MNYHTIYSRLKTAYFQEFQAIDETRHPIKLSFPLSGEPHNATEYVNVMTARVGNMLGTKMIYVNEVTHESSAKTLLCAGKEIFYIDSQELTRIRCALMAAIAIDCAGFSMQNPLVGLIGYGKINQKTQEILTALFRFSRFRIYDHHTQEHLHDLFPCDIIISATNNQREDQQVTPDNFQSRLFIAQDTGYLLNHEFRQRFSSYCDYPQQLQYHVSDEFPFDSVSPTFLPLVSLTQDHLPAVVYLFGIALADVIVAMYAKNNNP